MKHNATKQISMPTVLNYSGILDNTVYQLALSNMALYWWYNGPQ